MRKDTADEKNKTVLNTALPAAALIFPASFSGGKAALSRVLLRQILTPHGV
jgi:hypothetical protein